MQVCSTRTVSTVEVLILHFILRCPALNPERDLILTDIQIKVGSQDSVDSPESQLPESQLQLILDHRALATLLAIWLPEWKYVWIRSLADCYIDDILEGRDL